MNKKTIWYLVVALLVMITVTACAGSEPPPVEEQKPGAIAGNVYLSKESNFTLEADSKVWQTTETANGEADNLYLTKESNVWVSFSKTPGLSTEMIAEFETSFVESYMEGMRVSFPDTKKIDSKILSEQMARLDMTMTYEAGLYPMRQILYLVTDGENGYIITATLPEERAKELSPAIYKLVESLRFTAEMP